MRSGGRSQKKKASRVTNLGPFHICRSLEPRQTQVRPAMPPRWFPSLLGTGHTSPTTRAHVFDGAGQGLSTNPKRSGIYQPLPSPRGWRPSLLEGSSSCWPVLMPARKPTQRKPNKSHRFSENYTWHDPVPSTLFNICLCWFIFT